MRCCEPRIGSIASLTRLATRDAMLPILGSLFAAPEAGCSLTELLARLPPRYSRAALLKRFPQSVSHQIIRRFSPGVPELHEAVFGPKPRFFDSQGAEMDPPAGPRSRLEQIRREAGQF